VTVYTSFIIKSCNINRQITSFK